MQKVIGNLLVHISLQWCIHVVSSVIIEELL